MLLPERAKDAGLTETRELHVAYRVLGGNVAEWLGRRTWNPEVGVSSPILTTN